jgi:hypothetical protein
VSRGNESIVIFLIVLAGVRVPRARRAQYESFPAAASGRLSSLVAGVFRSFLFVSKYLTANDILRWASW